MYGLRLLLIESWGSYARSLRYGTQIMGDSPEALS